MSFLGGEDAASSKKAEPAKRPITISKIIEISDSEDDDKAAEPGPSSSRAAGPQVKNVCRRWNTDYVRYLLTL
jgi:hypothetical protein